jgi:hypothetical protein
VTEILHGLRGAQRDRIASLLEDGQFFWLDASLSDTSLDDLVEALHIPDWASQALASQSESDGPSRRFPCKGAVQKRPSHPPGTRGTENVGKWS